MVSREAGNWGGIPTRPHSGPFLCIGGREGSGQRARIGRISHDVSGAVVKKGNDGHSGLRERGG